MELEPFQKPHPPLWYGVISPDSAARAARARMNIIANTPGRGVPRLRRPLSRDLSSRRAGDDTPRMGINRYIVLAENEDKALDIARRAYRRWYAQFHDALAQVQPAAGRRELSA